MDVVGTGQSASFLSYVYPSTSESSQFPSSLEDFLKLK